MKKIISEIKLFFQPLFLLIGVLITFLIMMFGLIICFGYFIKLEFYLIDIFIK